MTGTFYMLSEPLAERRIELRIEAHVRDPRTGVASVHGRIDAEGLADHAVVQGTILLKELRSRRIPYDLRFSDLRLVGEKDLRWLAPVVSFATLPFTIVRGPDAWTEIARGTLHLDVRHEWRDVVRSLRVSPF